MNMNSFSKIFALGHRSIRSIFESGEVEITEKVDGSQFGFCKVFDEVGCRSKGRMINMDIPDKMFAQGVEQVERIAHLIPDGYKFWGEYLNKPKHNVIEYDRHPQNHIVLFGMESSDPHFEYSYGELLAWAELFKFDTMPLLFQGQLPNGIEFEFIEQLLDNESYLGGHKIEGFVVKNWTQMVDQFGQVSWPMAGKFVSEKFKEKHGQHSRNAKLSGWNAVKAQYQSEARWQKAVQHLKEEGLLLGEPKDIGPVLKEIQRDIIEECKDEIMHELWAVFHKELLKYATLGFPEWYKMALAKGEIN
ncbi:hypothetical protein KA005_01000 [bacterium]|nr:hypothetical protein [bacterium]